MNKVIKTIRDSLDRIKNEEFWRQLLKNVSAVLLGNTGASIFNFLTALIILKSVGNINYAYFVLAQQYMMLMDKLINFQSWQGVIKYATEYLLRKDNERLKAVFKEGMIIDFVTAFIGCAISFLIFPTVCSVMKWDETVKILGFIFCFEIIFHLEGTSTGILRTYNKFMILSIENIAVSFAQFVTIFIIYMLKVDNIVIYTIVYVIFDIIIKLGLVIMALAVLEKEMGIGNVLRCNVNKLEKDFLHYTIWTNINSTSDIPITYFDIFIISKLSVDMVAVYKIYKQIIQMISKLATPVSTAILPQFAILISENKRKDAYSKVIKIRNMVMLLMLPILLCSCLFGKGIMEVFLGTEYANNILLFNIMLIIYSISFAYIPIHPYFAALGLVKQDFVLNFLSNILYCIVLWILVKRWGVYAIVFATAVQFCITFSIKTLLIKLELGKEI